MGKKPVGIVLIVHLAAEMSQTIAYNQKTRLKHHIVSGYLVEDVLRYGYCWGFVFYDYSWRTITAEDNSIASSTGVV